MLSCGLIVDEDVFRIDKTAIIEVMQEHLVH